MSKEDSKIDFDLSTLSLEELIKVFDEITGFLKYLEENKIVEEEKVDDDE